MCRLGAADAVPRPVVAARSTVGGAPAGLSARPSIRWRDPILASSSPPSSAPASPTMLARYTRSSTAPAEKPRTALVSSSSCSPIVPRRPPWPHGLCSGRYLAPRRVSPQPVRRCRRRDHSAQAAQARRAGAHQRAPHPLRHRLGMSNKDEFELAHTPSARFPAPPEP